MAKHYEEHECVKLLKRNNLISINTIDKVIKYNSIGIGNSTWGKIDCLCNYYGYTKIKDNNIKSKHDINNEDKKNIREIKKDNKIFLIKNVKAIMKKYV